MLIALQHMLLGVKFLGVFLYTQVINFDFDPEVYIPLSINFWTLQTSFSCMYAYVSTYSSSIEQVCMAIDLLNQVEKTDYNIAKI